MSKVLNVLNSVIAGVERHLTCEACGTEFICSGVSLQGCWCSEVKVSETAREEWRAKYSDCLCRACLEKAASDNPGSEA